MGVTGAETAWVAGAKPVEVTGAETAWMTGAKPVGVTGAETAWVAGAEGAGVCVVVREGVICVGVALAGVEAEECTSTISPSERSSSSKETIILYVSNVMCD